jgi:DNA repair exonuclease SbcCD ATPase subunit
MKEMIGRLGVLKIRSRQSFYQRFGERVRPVKKIGNKNFYAEEHIQSLIDAELSGAADTRALGQSSDIVSVVNGRVLNDLIDEKLRLREENNGLHKRAESLEEALTCLNSRLESMVPRLEYHQRIQELENAEESLRESEETVNNLQLALGQACKERESLRMQALKLEELQEIQEKLEELSLFSFFKKRGLIRKRSELLGLS